MLGVTRRRLAMLVPAARADRSPMTSLDLVNRMLQMCYGAAQDSTRLRGGVERLAVS